MQNGKQKIGSIQLAPSWKAAMRIYIELLENGNAEGKETARAGIMEAAEKLDTINSAGVVVTSDVVNEARSIIENYEIGCGVDTSERFDGAQDLLADNMTYLSLNQINCVLDAIYSGES